MRSTYWTDPSLPDHRTKHLVKRCCFCTAENLHWEPIGDEWVMVTQDNVVHRCLHKGGEFRFARDGQKIPSAEYFMKRARTEPTPGQIFAAEWLKDPQPPARLRR